MRQTSALNRRAVAIISALSLAGLVSGLVLWVVQQRRVREAAIAEARKFIDAGEDAQAARQLADYLKSWPRDVDALRMMAEVSARPILRDHRVDSLGQLEAAIGHNEALLRNLDTSGDVKEIQEVRKRLIELYVDYGEVTRSRFKNIYQVMPRLTERDPWPLAQKLATQVVQQEAADAAREKRPFDPDICRLETLAVSTTLSTSSTPAEIKRVAGGYRAALLGTPGDPDRKIILGNPCPGQPGDLATAKQICRIYLEYYDVFRDDKAFRQDLDDIERGLIEEHPRSAEVRRIYHHIYSEARGKEAARDVPDPALMASYEARARAELAAALAAEPDSADVRLDAALDAMQRGDLDGAADHLRAIPEELRTKDLRVALVEGSLALAYKQPVNALEIWRNSQIESSGTDERLTWWLAYTHLQTRQLPKARRLIDAYALQDKDNADSPLYLILEGGYRLRSGQLEQAREILERIRNAESLSAAYKVKVELFLAELFRARNEPNEAKAAYDRAVQLDPRNPDARGARSEFLSPTDPEQGLGDLRALCRAYPNDPNQKQALAEAILRQLAAQPAGDRKFAEVDDLLESLRKAEGRGPSLVLLEANRLVLGDRMEQAMDVLEKALKPILSESPPASQKPPADAIELARSKQSEIILQAYVDALIRLGRQGEADRILALAAQPWNFGDRLPIRLARASRLLDQGRGREAQALLDAEAPGYPPSEQGQLKEYLGQLRLSQGDLPGARAAFDAWYRISGNYRAGLSLLDLAFLSSDLRLSEDILNRLKQPPRPSESTDPNLDFVATLAETAYQVRRLEVADAANKAKAMDAARGALERLEKQVPNMPQVHMLRGRFEEARGQVAEAVKAYKLAWADGQGSGSALIRLVGLYVRHREYDEELEQLRKRPQVAGGKFEQMAVEAAQLATNREMLVRLTGEAARIADMPADQRSYWGRRLLMLGQVEQAEDALREVARQRPQDPKAWFDLIRAQARRGDAPALARTIEQARQRVKTKRLDLFEARCLWSGNDLAGAEQAYRRILAKNPDDVEVLDDLALLARERKDTAGWIAGLRRVMQLDPERRGVRFDLASALAESGDPTLWAEAWSLLGEARADEAPEERLARAVVLIRATDPARKAQAIPALEALISDLPGTEPLVPPARKFLAKEYLVAGRPDRAQATILPITLTTDDPTALSLMIEALLARRQPDLLEEAASHLRRLAMVAPDDEGVPRYRLAIAVAGSGASKPGDALVRGVEQALSSADEKSLPQVAAVARLAVDQALAQAPPAVEAIEAIARLLAPKLPGTAWMLAAAQAQRGQLAQALATCQGAMPKARGRDRFDLARVACEVAVAPKATPEMIAQAESVIDAAKADGSPDADLLLVEAILRHRQGRYEDEVKLCRQALTLDPKNVMARNNLAWVLSEGLDQPSEALELIDGLIVQLGRKAALLDTRGMILLRLGRTPEAIHDLEEAGKPTAMAPTLVHLAQAYLRAGQEAEFRKYRDQARKAGINPDELDLIDRAEFAKLLERP
ncbi:MAG: tetratricopeptide repeat protein [Isosphaeraceae bacterium]